MAERKAFLLRIDPELYVVLSRWAADELRSLNGQIEYLLRQASIQGGRGPHRGGDEPEGSQKKEHDEHTRS